MNYDEAIKRIQEHKDRHFAQEFPHAPKITEALDIALSALRAQQEREDPKPLTLDEVLSRKGEPVYWVCKNGVKFWHVVDAWTAYPDSTIWQGYGEDFVCYDYPPKEPRVVSRRNPALDVVSTPLPTTATPGLRRETSYLNGLAKEIYDIAKSKGWHDNDPVGFGDCIANIHGEASEAFEVYRAGKSINELYIDDAEGKEKPCGIPSEFADIVIRVLDNCAMFGIDIDEAVRIKMEYNRTRSYRHGGKVV